MTTQGGWPSQSNPGQNNPGQNQPGQSNPGAAQGQHTPQGQQAPQAQQRPSQPTQPAQPRPQGYPGAQQAPSSASAHQPAGYPNTQQPYGAPVGQAAPASPKAPADVSKILSLVGLAALGVAFVLLVISFIVALAGTGEDAEGYAHARGLILIYTSIGLGVIGAGLYVGSLVQALTAKLTKD